MKAGLVLLGVFIASAAFAHPPGNAPCEPVVKETTVIIQEDCAETDPVVVVCPACVQDSRPRLIRGRCKTTKRDTDRLKCRRAILQIPGGEQ